MCKIKSFKYDYFFLSNFYTSRIMYNGLTYSSNEAAFQAQKCVNTEDMIRFTVLSAGSAKKLGRKIKLRDDWESVKVDIMKEICFCKFRQNESLCKDLLATGDAYLEEGNTWGDTFWGTVNGVGENHLGKILMEVRDTIRHPIKLFTTI